VRCGFEPQLNRVRIHRVDRNPIDFAQLIARPLSGSIVIG